MKTGWVLKGRLEELKEKGILGIYIFKILIKLMDIKMILVDTFKKNFRK